MDTMTKFWINSELFAVGLGSFVGVAVRFGLIELFDRINYSSEPSKSYEYFITILGDQSFLISNFLGCFMIAIFQAYTDDICAMSIPLMKFLTTGVCGCLTTFSSWIVQTSSNGAFKGWFAIIVMIGMEFCFTWCGLLLGFSCATCLKGRAIIDDSVTETAVIQDQADNQNEGLCEDAQQHDDQIELTASINQVNTTLTQSNAAVCYLYEKEFYCWMILFAITATVFWLLLIVDAASLPVYKSNQTRNFCEAVAFAPFGLWFRWGLSRVLVMRSVWPDMNLHTLLANYLAVTLTCCLILYAPSHRYVKPVITGMMI
jgi:fluoride ion exporter CrcB/FEX